jgi:hypothetical protein
MQIFLFVGFHKKETYIFVGLFCENRQAEKDALLIRKFYLDSVLGCRQVETT